MNAPCLRPGDTLTCRVEKLVYGGDGLARADGRVLFIPGTAPGETVTARVTQVRPRYARAEALALADPSPDRLPSPCCRVTDPDTGAPERVPGCVYDHLAYPAEVEAKRQQLESFLSRLPGGGPAQWLPPVPAPSPLRYRNKIVLHASRAPGRRTRLGYRLEPSHRVLDIADCPLALPPLAAALEACRRTALDTLPDGADVTFRHTPHDGPLWWRGRPPAPPALPPYLTEASPAGPLRVPPDGFYQVNPPQGDALVRAVAARFAETCPAQAELVDLYCGVGVFGLACVQAAPARLTGVESGRAAVAAARLNAADRQIPAAFHCLDLGTDRLPPFAAEPRRTTVVVDPPRDGLPPALARALAEGPAAQLLYVSCDPATLARDLALILAAGRYRLERAGLFDLFPRTAHFETLVELRLR